MNPSRHFLNYVHAHATQWRSSALVGRQQHDQAWISKHPALVVAEWRRACAWLASQPDVPNVGPTGRSDASRMANFRPMASRLIIRASIALATVAIVSAAPESADAAPQVPRFAADSHFSLRAEKQFAWADGTASPFTASKHCRSVIIGR